MGLNVCELEGVLFIELDNIENGNSFGLVEAEELLEVYEEWKESQIFGLVFSTVSQRFFCAGGNLKFYATQTTPQEGRLANRQISLALNRLAKWPIATVAVVEGDCFGGGMELLSCFDHVISTPESFFGLWQRRIGLSYGWGGGKRFLEFISRRRLRSLSLSTETFSASAALKYGFVDEVAANSKIYEMTERWIYNQNSLTKSPIAALKGFNPDSERSLFEKLWWNKEHKSILNRVRERLQI